MGVLGDLELVDLRFGALGSSNLVVFGVKLIEGVYGCVYVVFMVSLLSFRVAEGCLGLSGEGVMIVSAARPLYSWTPWYDLTLDPVPS